MRFWAVRPMMSLPLAAVAVALSVGATLAQDGSTSVVPKKANATGTVAPLPAPTPGDHLRPAQDVEIEPPPIEAAAPVDEIDSTSIDQGAGWDAAVQANAPTPLIGEEQVAAISRINAYFNSITNLQGSFEQVDSTNKRTTGRFYVQRPGKLRFDYAPPSGLRMVADGHFLAIEDSDLKTVEKYPLKSTPFRLLLADAVDLARDARIIGVEAEDGAMAIALEDKSGEASGQIKLSFDTEPEFELKQWVITDAQGLTTRVALSDVVSGRKVAAGFFSATETFQPFR